MTGPLIGLLKDSSSTSRTPTSAKEDVSRASSSHGDPCIVESPSSGINYALKENPRGSSMGFSNHKKLKLEVKEPQSSLSSVGHLGGK